MRNGQVVGYKFRQVRHIGPREAREKLAPVLPRQVLGREPLQRTVLEVGEVAPSERRRTERIACDELGVEQGGEIGRDPGHFLLVVEAQSEMRTNVI